MSGRKTSQLQIRVTPRQKAELRRLANAAGTDVSAFVLQRALPDRAVELQSLIDRLAISDAPSYDLAALNDRLSSLSPAEFEQVTGPLDVRRLPSWRAAYVASMIEHAACLKRVAPPAWTSRVGPLDRPFFASQLRAVRLHLLARSPPAFRRRNIFVDSTVGDRI